MIRLRHVLHPIRSAKHLYQQVGTRTLRAQAERTLSGMQRGRQDTCWCGGRLDEFAQNPKYGQCKECQGYVNRFPPLPEDLGRLYSFGFYWNILQRHRGHPTIKERTEFDRSDGRLEYWLQVFERHAPARGTVLEVGCAHGVLLRELDRRGYKCIGVEVDKKTVSWTAEKTGLDIRRGVFPDMELPSCDVFLCFDVLEHSLDPVKFLRRATQILSPGGVAIIQSPIEYEKRNPPFAEMCEKTFDDSQHVFILSRKGIHLLAAMTGFEVVAEDSWRVGHEIAVLRKVITT